MQTIQTSDNRKDCLRIYQGKYVWELYAQGYLRVFDCHNPYTSLLQLPIDAAFLTQLSGHQKFLEKKYLEGQQTPATAVPFNQKQNKGKVIKCKKKMRKKS